MSKYTFLGFIRIITHFGSELGSDHTTQPMFFQFFNKKYVFFCHVHCLRGDRRDPSTNCHTATFQWWFVEISPPHLAMTDVQQHDYSTTEKKRHKEIGESVNKSK